MEAKELLRRYKAANTGEVTVPFIFDRASGSYVFDREGNAVLDFSSGYGVANTGWMHPRVLAAMEQQLQKSTYAPPWFATEQGLELSELLLGISPGMDACVRATGGADAMEAILKAVFALTGKREIISFQRAYHGGTGRAIRLSDFQAFNLPEMPGGSFTYHKVSAPWCLRCPLDMKPASCGFACLEQTERLLKSKRQIAAFVVEPVLGSGGVIVPPEGYLMALSALCRQYSVLMVYDEVITGFGRLGAMSAAELYHIQPDAIAYAKGMGSGYVPVGAALLNTDLAEALRRYEDVTPTFSWTPLACAAACANIRLIQAENLPIKALQSGIFLLENIRRLFEAWLPDQTAEVRGQGMAIGVELVKDKENLEPAPRLVNKLLLAFFKEGLMCCASWDSRVLVLLPPLTLSQPEMESGLAIMERVLRRYGSASKTGMEGAVAHQAPI
jgi:4-aminobutyrate aminotransferase-like enzyme